MLQIQIYKNKREFRGFSTKGHAGSGEEGYDIVCAAASTLIINTMNAIELFTKDEIGYVDNQDEGKIEFEFKKTPSKDATLLMKTLVLGLEEMDKDEEYSKYIELKFKEV
ncbi:uncharacterized protein YsxB (DUF464 family) [Aequitasia blattaphilus]|uniref:Ribosomal processing cysteine protease Prp n=1 Tax=Aequitasia blattaphilus TaxID=2949332 RepID=A0ABT1E5G2_9FIRM|nr:ribosomal-processing cysteine protease Prp [Aequitasia blattaphilus]MCP1101071.1 ribosomal-processing cysteine protease Prp [Aequitasia blattaphilus]MCR8613711.1 ribosomal-processing cysteine protease Prp [Aequitasia blattaphilus]